jgi:hypothetical protein
MTWLSVCAMGSSNVCFSKSKVSLPATLTMQKPPPVGETDRYLIQRRGGDSNSRYPCGQTGFRNQLDADASNDTGASCDPATTGLPASLRIALEQCPELAKLIESWPHLPQSMRIGIIAMVESSAKGR